MTEIIFLMVISLLIASIGDFYLGSAFQVIVLIMAMATLLFSLFAICKSCMLLCEMWEESK